MEWETSRNYLNPYRKEIAEGKPIEITVFDHGTYERKLVKAIVYHSFTAMPGVDRLWIKDASDWLEPEPWGIKVLEELGEDFTRYTKGEYEARSWRA